MNLRPLRRPTLAALAFSLASLAASADTIYLLDGSALTDVDVVAEELGGVTYRQKGKSGEQRVDPDQILSIEYKRLPTLIDQAETLIRDGAILDGIERLDQFAESVFSGENKRDKQAWAPAYALDRILRLQGSVGDLDAVVKTADRVLDKVPSSRHVPGALIEKAMAQRAQGKEAAAQATLDALQELIASRGLSKRWSLELDLARALGDSKLEGQPKRDRLLEIAGQAGQEWPMVRNRARVCEGESYLEGAKPEFDKAQKLFAGIVADPMADEPTLAGAYTGLGDCLFNSGAEKIKSGGDAKAELNEALVAYMRVVVNYKDQANYAAKAMFFAGRVFDYLGDDQSKGNARRLYSAVILGYPASKWAAEARNYRK